MSPDQIILIGQSIGTAACVDLATEVRNLAGVVLIAGLLSALHVVDNSEKGKFRKKLQSCDQFRNLTKIKDIACPVLVVHGKEDKTIPLAHGVALYENCQNAVPPLWLPDATHNNVSNHPSLWIRLQKFISHDLKGGPLCSQTYRKILDKAFLLKDGRTKVHSACLATGCMCPTCVAEFRNGQDHDKTWIAVALTLAASPSFMKYMADQGDRNDATASNKTICGSSESASFVVHL